jgi:hypothetical protein
MKRFVIPALLAALALTAFAQDSNRPRKKTYAVLPGKTVNIRNKVFHTVEIRSEYPVQIAAGDCHNDYTVQWTCKFDDPTDLFIRDLRQWPLLATPRSNTIVVTGSDE